MDTNMKKLDEIIKRVRTLTDDLQEELLVILRGWQDGKQREYKRFQTDSDIDVVIDDKVIQTSTDNISASGVFVKASSQIELNKGARVVFNVPGHDKPFKLQGKIARIEDGGFAINFENVSPYFKKILDDILQENQK
jgi:hypothetical protein